MRLTLGQPVAPGRPVTLSYFKDGTAARHRLKDANGNEVANIDDEPVANADGAGAAPRLAQATVEGRTLTLVFDRGAGREFGPDGGPSSRRPAIGRARSPWGCQRQRGDGRGQADGRSRCPGRARRATTAWVHYVNVKGNDNLRGAGGGKEVEDFRNWQAAVLDGSGPAAVAGSVSGTDGTKVTLHFDEALDPDSDAGDHGLRGDGGGGGADSSPRRGGGGHHGLAHPGLGGRPSGRRWR